MSTQKNTPIREIARVIRSKNSGPYELTLDIIFSSPDIFKKVRASGTITPQMIAGLYGIDEAMVKAVVFFPPANAVKIVMVRKTVSGSPGDSDVYGAQQHAPLLKLEFAL